MHPCPTCGQPATRAFPPDEGWECRNEACPEFGQKLPEVEPPPPSPPSPREPRQVVEAFLASIADLDVAMQYIADDIVYENIGTFPLTMRSRAATRRLLKTAFKLGSGFAIEVHSIAADGPLVLTERTDMFLFGDAQARFWVCGKFEVRDGKIVHWRDYFDNANVLTGLLRGAAEAAIAKATRR